MSNKYLERLNWLPTNIRLKQLVRSTLFKSIHNNCQFSNWEEK